MAPNGWISLLSVPPQYTWAVPHHTLPAECAGVAAQAGVLPGGKAQPGADDAGVTGNPRNDFDLGAALPADVPPTVDVPPTIAEEASRPHHSEPFYSSYDSSEVMAAVTAVAFSDSSVSSADTDAGSMPISRADSEDATIPPWLRTEQPRADDARGADAGDSSAHQGGLGVAGSHADSASMPMSRADSAEVTITPGLRTAPGFSAFAAGTPSASLPTIGAYRIICDGEQHFGLSAGFDRYRLCSTARRSRGGS